MESLAHPRAVPHRTVGIRFSKEVPPTLLRHVSL